MDSLTTAYLVSLVIGSLTSIAAALAGNKAFPIESSAIVPVTAEPTTPVAPPQSTVQTQPVASSVVQ